MSQTNQNLDSDNQHSYRTDAAKNVLESVLTASGFEAGDLQIALEAIKQAKELSKTQEENDAAYKNILDKTLVYEDRDAFIYRRGDTKSGRWYLWIYDKEQNKRVQKSLRTTDKTQALTSARFHYIDIKGKIERGERLKSITTPELIKVWDEKLKAQITDIPHEGITLGSYRAKRRFMQNWLEYIQHLSLSKTPIDKIDVSKTREFGTWLKNKPKTFQKGKARSLETVNACIREVVRMYKELAVRDKYISINSIPQIDKVKMQRDNTSKRDVLTEEEYEKLWRYIQYTYITKKHNPNPKKWELEKRKIFKEFIFIMSNVGFRVKELIGMRMNDIMDNPKWDLERRETDVLMKVRRENSKTGKSRVCVAPVKKRLQRIIDAYEKIGIKHQPSDYLFMNPSSETREHYSYDIMSHRLKVVLEQSNLKQELDKQNKSITLYSFRHQYATWRLRYGDVPIHLLAKQMGTGIDKIMSTYGHIEVEKQADVLTKSQEHIKRTGFVLAQPEVIEEQELIHSQPSDAFVVEEVVRKRKKSKV